MTHDWNGNICRRCGWTSEHARRMAFGKPEECPGGAPAAPVEEDESSADSLTTGLLAAETLGLLDSSTSEPAAPAPESPSPDPGFGGGGGFDGAGAGGEF